MGAQPQNRTALPPLASCCTVHTLLRALLILQCFCISHRVGPDCNLLLLPTYTWAHSSDPSTSNLQETVCQSLTSCRFGLPKIIMRNINKLDSEPTPPPVEIMLDVAWTRCCEEQ